MAEIFSKKGKDQNRPNQPSPARQKRKHKPVQSAKKRKSKEEEKKTVTQLRGYWTKFAEQQKEKRKKIEVKIPNKTEETPKSPAFIEPELACSNTSANSSNSVRDGEKLPERSNLPGNPRIKLKSEMNCSRESSQTGIKELRKRTKNPP